MNAEIWFFFTPDGKQEITVLDKESAETVAHLMSQQQRHEWKCRRNRSHDSCFVFECAELGQTGGQLVGHPNGQGNVHSEVPHHQLGVTNEEARGHFPQHSANQPGHSANQPGQHPANQPGQHSANQPGQHSANQPGQQQWQPPQFQAPPPPQPQWQPQHTQTGSQHLAQPGQFQQPQHSQWQQQPVNQNGMPPQNQQWQQQPQGYPQHQVPPAAPPSWKAPLPPTPQFPQQQQPPQQQWQQPQATQLFDAGHHQMESATQHGQPDHTREHEHVEAVLPEPKKNGAEKRRHQRTGLRLRVVLIAGNRSFRTYSKDVSKGGMSFEHVVPKDLIGKTCKVIIGSSDMKENLEFEASIAGDAHNPRAIEFQDAKEVFLSKLESWLADARKKVA